MIVLSADQVKAWDQFTIQHEPVSSIDLMERAAQTCVHWILTAQLNLNSVTVFCGKGNNGGDGLVIARALFLKGYRVQVAILENGKSGTPDFQHNLERLREIGLTPFFISSIDHFPDLSNTTLVVDTIFGTGLNRPLAGLEADLIERINQRKGIVISVDLPSGLPADQAFPEINAIIATHTLTFQCYKPVLLCAQWASWFGKVHVLDIGLSPDFFNAHAPLYRIIDLAMARSIYKPRLSFSHKGDHGAAALIAGSPGMMGAALLAANSCLRSGIGKLTLYVPWTEREIPQTALPEAMVRSVDDITSEKEINFLKGINAIGIGPGWGLGEQNREYLLSLFKQCKTPMVLDADALNLIATHSELWDLIPEGSILTPHPGEANRLWGKANNELERQAQLNRIATEKNMIIVLKGHRTFIALPAPAISLFNITGNSGLAKGGSGDSLTGIITSFLAQGYTPEEAAVMGVFLHGKASEILASDHHETEETMLPGMLPDTFPRIFQMLRS